MSAASPIWDAVNSAIAENENNTLDKISMVRLDQASQLQILPIRWLWRGWLALGKLHVLAGAPSTGKTTIAIAIAAVVSSGGDLPMETPVYQRRF